MPFPLTFLSAFVLCREKTLRNISLTYQQFQNSNENLMFWMNNLPKHQVKTTDGPSQINYKLQAQKVCSRARIACNFTGMGQFACEQHMQNSTSQLAVVCSPITVNELEKDCSPQMVLPGVSQLAEFTYSTGVLLCASHLQVEILSVERTLSDPETLHLGLRCCTQVLHFSLLEQTLNSLARTRSCGGLCVGCYLSYL